LDLFSEKGIPSSSIHVLSYLGFCKENQTQVYGIEAQLEAKIQTFVDISRDWSPQTRIVLVGHSIGAWFALEIHKRFQDQFSIQLHLLFPFIIRSNTKIQKQYETFLSNPILSKFAGLLYKSIRKLPLPTIHLLLHLILPHSSEKSVRLILEYFIRNKGIVDNIFHLARDEFHTLKSQFDLEYLQKFKDSIIFYYCEGDIWAPLSQLEILKKEIPSLRFSVLSLINHDFCINERQSQLVANEVFKNLD
jgi:pimeloyl-ACP methyl ester carboxylesterase